tara:strand:- start:700 stop:1581 length:882 start_codon:yes stop_codon:yes gene_type:complete
MAYQPILPAESSGFKTTTILTAGTSLVYNSPLLDSNGYTQVQTEVFADQDGTMTFEFLSDAGGTDVVRTLIVPYTAANGYQLFAAPAFTNYIRYEFDNDSGSDQTDFYFTTKLLTRSLSPQTLRIDGFLAPAMMANVSRAVIVGQDAGGAFNNVSTVETINAAGTTQNLQVVSGARPSQIAGRTAVTVLSDNETAPTLLYTVTALKKLYITDILLTLVNQGSVTGRLEIYDALSAVGSPALPINAADPGSGGDDTLTTFTHTFAEPMEFSTGIYFEEAAGTLIMSGILIGYEE